MQEHAEEARVSRACGVRQCRDRRGGICLGIATPPPRKVFGRSISAPALDVLHATRVGADDPQLRFRHESLRADALEALGQTDAARDTLQQLSAEFPTNARLRRRLDNARGNAS